MRTPPLRDLTFTTVTVDAAGMVTSRPHGVGWQASAGPQHEVVAPDVFISRYQSIAIGFRVVCAEP